jgi:hypothetical protein
MATQSDQSVRVLDRCCMVVPCERTLAMRQFRSRSVGNGERGHLHVDKNKRQQCVIIAVVATATYVRRLSARRLVAYNERVFIQL